MPRDDSSSVLYHSRMMYLTSPSLAPGSSLDHHLHHSSSAHTQAIHGYPVNSHRKVQCREEKLVPPKELMTRPQALR